MVRKVLVDINVPKEVCVKLRELGFSTLYLTDILPSDTDDRKILKWTTKHHALVLTRDKEFSKAYGKDEIILVHQSTAKLIREAFMKLMSRQVFPKSL